MRAQHERCGRCATMNIASWSARRCQRRAEVRGLRADARQSHRSLRVERGAVKLRSSFISPIPHYDLDEDWHNLGGVFVTYSRGSKSGGLNFRDLPRDANGNVQPQLLILKPEIVDHFEAGLKTQWFGRRLTVNASVFHTGIRDYQNTVVDQSGTISRSYISNVGSVRSRGIELEIRARPVPTVAGRRMS
jgi:hypothetical protein